MGKHNNRKRFRGGAVRSNPMDIEEPLAQNGSSSPAENPEDVLTKITSQLQSGSSEDRECGLTTLAQLDATTSESAIRSFRLVRIAAPLLIDSNLSVKHACVGALKNLSLVSAEICDEMIEQDIMTPLCALLSSYNSDWSPVYQPSAAETANSPKSKATTTTIEKIDSKTEIFVEAVNLLWNLCEASDLALKIVNENQIVPFLINHLNLSKFGSEVVTPVLQSIYSITEDNSLAAPVVREREESFKIFLKRHSIKASDLHHSILAYGIFLNTAKAEEEGSGLPDVLLPGLMVTISQVLEQDQRKLIHDYSSATPMDDKDDLQDCSDPATERMRQIIDDVLLAQQTALEIFTNICCDETSGEWEDAESSDDDEEEAMSADETNGSTTSSNPVPSLPTIVQEAIASHGLVGKVLAKTSLPAANVLDILKVDRRSANIRTMVESLRSRAFLCINNLVQALAVEDLGGPENLFLVWTTIGKQCFDSEESNSNSEFLESATSALRAITQKLQDAQSAGFLKALSPSDVEKMLVTGASSTDVGVRMNIVNISGNIALLHVAQTTSPILETQTAQLKAIVLFLLEAAARDVDLRVVAEALDKVIDIFTEDETDQFCVEVGLITRLKQLLPGLKVKMGQLRRQVKKSDENFGLISMAKNNLTRFIKYKEKRPIVAKSLSKN